MLTFQEIYSIMEQKNSADILYSYWEDGTLSEKIPCIGTLEQWIHHPLHHPEGRTEDEYGTVLHHVLGALRIAEEHNFSTDVKTCVLFHDIGKGRTASGYEEGHLYHRFYGHDKVGFLMMKDCLSRYYNIPENLFQMMLFCIKNHMRFYQIPQMNINKREYLFKNEYWNELVQVCLCDGLVRQFAFAKDEYQNIIEMQKQFVA